MGAGAVAVAVVAVAVAVAGSGGPRERELAAVVNKGPALLPPAPLSDEPDPPSAARLVRARLTTSPTGASN